MVKSQEIYVRRSASDLGRCLWRSWYCCRRWWIHHERWVLFGKQWNLGRVCRLTSTNEPTTRERATNAGCFPWPAQSLCSCLIQAKGIPLVTPVRWSIGYHIFVFTIITREANLISLALQMYAQIQFRVRTFEMSAQHNYFLFGYSPYAEEVRQDRHTHTVHIPTMDPIRSINHHRVT